MRRNIKDFLKNKNNEIAEICYPGFSNLAFLVYLKTYSNKFELAILENVLINTQYEKVCVYRHSK